MVAQDLHQWIGELRGRIARSDSTLDQPFDLGDGTLVFPGTHTIRIMLYDLADVEEQCAAPQADWRVRRRRDHLLEDFQRLRELLG